MKYIYIYIYIYTRHVRDTYKVHTGYIHERIQNDYDTIYPVPKTTRPSRKKYKNAMSVFKHVKWYKT